MTDRTGYEENVSAAHYDHLRTGSILANALGYRIAEALGKVTRPDSYEGDPAADLEELISLIPPARDRQDRPAVGDALFSNVAITQKFVRLGSGDRIRAMKALGISTGFVEVREHRRIREAVSRIISSGQVNEFMMWPES